MSIFEQYLETISKKTINYDNMINFLVKEINKTYKIGLKATNFDIRDLQLEWDTANGTSYQVIAKNISQYSKNELLKITIDFLKRKGKIKK